ncbi:ammonium transporter AmtB-like domain-containing protein [Chytriomyces sp. MP71]|nr:ammonium transporter AmtB-like domain-containing protein [Chytriomyces sp. MP71]
MTLPKFLWLVAVLATGAVAQNSSSPAPTASPLVAGDMAWILISSAIVFIQVPGLGLYYAGLAESKNSLSTMLSVMLTLAVVFVQWSLFGYSLAFSDSSPHAWIGDLRFAALLNTLETQNSIAPTIPNALLCMYQMMFAAITAALALGGTAGRMRLFPTMVFMFLWTTLVYDVIAYWTWSNNGWLHNLNVMDFAGGSVVHVASGVTGGILSLLVGKRVDYGKRAYENHSPTYVYIGTAMLWFGWMGFNGGSAVAADVRAVSAALNTNLAAAMGGLTWMALEKLVNKKKFSAIGFCSGVVVALVGITPASGFVKPAFGLAIGSLTAISSFFAIKGMHFMRLDDSLDVFACHGVGGAVGMILTGIFASYDVTTLDTTSQVTAGWISGVWIQVPIQLAGIGAVTGWTSVVTVLIVGVMNLVPGLKLRCTAEDEIDGLDICEVSSTQPY